MNNSIKEILDRLDFNEWEVDLYKVPITWSELYDIRDYITNLQKENEKLKQQLDFIDEQNKYIDKIEKMIKDYKSRNEKAVEYIENHSRFEPPYYEMREFNNKANLNELYNILQGGDE